MLNATGTMPALMLPRNAGKVDGIEQTEQHTLFGPYVQARERVGAAIHSRGQLAKRIAAPVVDERDLPRTARREVTLDEIVRRVVDPRDLHPWRAHPVIGSAESGMGRSAKSWPLAMGHPPAGDSPMSLICGKEWDAIASGLPISRRRATLTHIKVAPAILR